MKSTLKNLLTFSLLALIISSCGGKKASILVPEDAGMVIHINAASLSSKLSWDEIKNSEWFKMADAEGASNDFERKLLNNPESSGIDLKSDLYFFIKPSGNNSYASFQGKIKDAKAFEEFVKKMSERSEVKKDGDINYAADGKNVITWTSDRFIVAGEASGMNSASGFGGFQREVKKLTADSVINFAKGLYGLKSSSSIAGNSKFMSMLNEKGDIHVWIGSDLTGGQISKQLSMFKAASVLQGNSTAMTINFDNGKITGSAKNYYNKELTDLYKKYPSGNVNTDMLKKIPGDNVAAVLALNYQPEGLKAFLKLLGVDGLADGYLSEAGISLDEIIAANKGDLLLAVSDFSVKEREVKVDLGGGKPFVHKTHGPDANILFATSIANKAAFDKLMETATKAVEGLGDKAGEVTSRVKYEIKDGWFLLGSSQENLTAYSSSTGKEHAFISKISGHPMGLYINIKKIMDGIDPNNMGMMGRIVAGNGTNIWEDVVAYGGEMKDGATTSYFEINLVDKNANSLKQLNNYFGAIAKNYKSSFDGMKEMDFPAMDSAAAPPVVPPPAVEIKPAH